jgi:glycosyltransferase involved in cell wall biosynthesis
MKIIQVNKFLYPKGGADKYCLTLIEELEKSDEIAIPFGMADSKNYQSNWSKYYSENIDYHKSSLFKIVTRLIWNREAAAKFASLLNETKPDLIHVHNIYHQLSPSILQEAKKRKIPVIMTVHDYKLICPNYLLFTHGKHCELCLSGNYLNCVTHNCYYSYSRSVLAALESFLHNRVWYSYQKNISLFISPSKYLKDKMIKAGWDANKITVLNNPAPQYEATTDGTRLVYIGRLALEKGVDSLISALAMTKESLDIIGSGPEAENLKLLADKLNLKDRITFHGNLNGEELELFKKEAKAIIVPSVWAENMSLVLLEALAYGKLIIASASGGTPELIEDSKTGFLFTPGDIQDLARKINNLNTLSSEQRIKMAEFIKEKIVPLELKDHLVNLKNIYNQVKLNS